MAKKPFYLIGIDEVGRPNGRASPYQYIIGIDEAGRAARYGQPRPNFIIGIDEAGRGPLAGPVVVAGVLIATRGKRHVARQLYGIRDSKKLSAKKREEWFRKLTSNSKIEWAVAKVWPKVIDRINITNATNLGVRRVYKKLKLNKVASRLGSKNKNFIVRACPVRNSISNGACREHTLLDGGLKLPSHISFESIIKGDEKIPIISAASIIAKVIRDRLMIRLHKKYPKYRFDIHKGYGTKLHRKLLKKFGRSEIHRKSFRFS
ncbi:MAG: Ribonuclease HII [Parcubacteria group bacterium GW2011_GWA2_42_14]|nr:MAG: Ribonuclease HII [Parcubacteria group bacterium GW2011_GWA2_42_14]